jgi:hypothetical protein
MQTTNQRQRPIVLPIRLSRTEYAHLAELAEWSQNTRTGMIRRLIVLAARRTSRERRLEQGAAK